MIQLGLQDRDRGDMMLSGSYVDRQLLARPYAAL